MYQIQNLRQIKSQIECAEALPNSKKDKMPHGTSKNKQNIMVEDKLNKVSKNLLNRMSEDLSKKK